MDDLELQSRLSEKETKELYLKLSFMDAVFPTWRTDRLPNGMPMWSLDGTLLDEQGNRSIFDDVDD
jgi:hypothetical protein